MATDVLAEIGLTMAQLCRLGSDDRSRLLHFLLRWEHAEALLACLDALTPLHPNRVSLLDLRVQALVAQGQVDQALAAMQERLHLKASATAHLLLARVHLARGDLEAADRVVRSLIEGQDGAFQAWELRGEIALRRGDIQAAQAACARLNELRPQCRAYLWGMVAIHRARRDWVTASGYAVRLLQTASQEAPLSVADLRGLREYFGASGETTRVADLDADLVRRRADELAGLQAALAHAPSQKPGFFLKTGFLASPPPAELLPTFDQVPVSPAERARIEEATRRLFGFDTLLPGQVETMACVLRGEDVLVILPTGGGKSLCYQLPALLAERGVTLVISPLIALMKDQVDSLPAGVRRRATSINSSLDREELRGRLEQVALGGQGHAGGCRLVYAAPERLRQPPFLHALRRAGVNRLVIDEAHCISLWGNDFRPDYLAIGQARRALGGPPLLALTATAPTRVRRDILNQLGPLRVIAGDVTRLNLQLQVFYAGNTDEKLRHLLAFGLARSAGGPAEPGIVYVSTRAQSEELAALLRRYGVSAGHYHAGLPDRDRVQDDFMAGRIRVVVATVAFGLGIDKGDVRFIVHYDPPPSLEAYYQEAGRAGRDGLPARCLLMYAPSDRATLTRRAHQDALSVESLRAVYGAVKRRLGGASIGPVAEADLERDLADEDASARLRVALSLLEKAALLRRGPDLPRAAVVCLTTDEFGDHLPDLAAFCRAARLRPGQSLTVDLAQAAQQAGLPAGEVEYRLLEWADAGWLSYSPSGRDLLLELLPPPPDAAGRIAALLEEYDVVQGQRVDEISAYVQTVRCRHGHLNAYLGGRAIARCAACDNCLPMPPPPEAGLPSEKEQGLAVLRCLSGSSWGWGRQNLAHILRGDAEAPPRARGNTSFGALAFRSETAIGHLLDRLLAGGLLRARQLDHGGVVLELTAAGAQALKEPAVLDNLIPPSARR